LAKGIDSDLAGPSVETPNLGVCSQNKKQTIRNKKLGVGQPESPSIMYHPIVETHGRAGEKQTRNKK
jgi:hypothetical protein